MSSSLFVFGYGLLPMDYGLCLRMYDLSTFSLKGMAECGAALRKAGLGAKSME